MRTDTGRQTRRRTQRPCTEASPSPRGWLRLTKSSGCRGLWSGNALGASTTRVHSQLQLRVQGGGDTGQGLAWHLSSLPFVSTLTRPVTKAQVSLQLTGQGRAACWARTPRSGGFGIMSLWGDPHPPTELGQGCRPCHLFTPGQLVTPDVFKWPVIITSHKWVGGCSGQGACSLGYPF